jgi:protein-disulfide isomerase
MDEKQKTTQPEKVSLAVPAAIIAAGIIVAGAIIWNGSQSGAPAKIQDETAAKLTKGTIAEEIGLKKADFQKCLTSGEMKEAVSEDMASAERSGVEGTPFSIIMAKDGALTSINGAYPYEDVKKIIDDALAERTMPEKGLKVDPVTAKDHIMGSISAPVKIIEYSDTECPFCARFFDTMKQIMAEYGKDNRVAWVYRHVPLESLHSRARYEAEATECAAKIGGNDAFWKYLETLERISPLNNGLDPALL